MIIVLNDDPVYVSWIRRHRNGFVLATKRKATKRNTMMHRASCPEIRKSKTKRTHWTTGGRAKACSVDYVELLEWAREQVGRQPNVCRLCNPGHDTLSGATSDPHSTVDQHLTKLENDILSAVVESAVIHLDNELDFQMTVGDVAKYLEKTPVLITAALRRLVSVGMLEIETTSADNAPIPPNVRVLPTGDALKTIPAFAELDPEQLQEELETLHT